MKKILPSSISLPSFRLLTSSAIPSGVISFLVILFLTFAFAACGDDSGTSTDNVLSGNEEISSSTNSTASVGSTTLSSTGSSASRSSSSANKVSSSSGKGKNISSSSSSKSFKKCTSDREGVRAFVTQENSWCICINGQWIPESSSSFVEPSSSSKYYDMTKQFFSDYYCNFGEFVDPRDNQVYKTIRIKSIWTEDSVTFFAENLNYGKMIPAGTQQTDSTKYCYDDDPWYCENGFGGLYTWATAMNFPAVCDSFLTGSVECPDTVDLTKHSDPFLKGKVGYAFHQGICPEGWHIMDEGDWVDIIHGHGYILGANYLGSYIWGGSNERGFSLLPAGVLEPPNRYMNIGDVASHWFPADKKRDGDSLTSYGKSVNIRDRDFNRSASAPKVYGLSVRCVMDY